MRWLPALAFGLLLALPAAAGVLAEVASSRVSAQDQVDLQGTLVALAIDLRHWDSSQIPQGLVLEAPGIDLRIDHNDANVTVAGFQAQPERWHSRESLANVRFEPSAIRPGLIVFVVPLDGRPAPVLSLQADGGTLTASDGDRKDQFAYATTADHQPRSADTSQAIVVEAVDASLTVSGDFELVLWDVDLVDAVSGRELLTGNHVRAIAGGPPGTPRSVEETKESQAYLTVHGGSLTLTLPQLAPDTLFVGRADVQADTFVLESAVGALNLPGDEVAAGEVVTLRGRLDLAIEPRAGDGLHATVSGEPSEARLGSRPLNLVAGAPLGGTSLALLLFAPAALCGVGLAFRRRHARAFRRAEAAMERGDYAAAAKMPKALLGRRFGPEASVLRTTALLRLGRTDEARKQLEAWPRHAYPWDRDYLLAYLAAQRGQWVEASDLLRSCVEQNPPMAEAVAANPVFAPLFSTRPPRPAPASREGYT